MPLDDILDAVRPILAEENLAVTWTTEDKDGHLWVECRVLHATEQMSTPTVVARAGLRVALLTDWHAMGSALTYVRRYTLTLVLPIVGCDEDDDAQTAMAAGSSRAKNPPPKPPAWSGLTEADIGANAVIAAKIEAATDPVEKLKLYQAVSSSDQKSHLWGLLSKQARAAIREVGKLRIVQTSA